MLLEGHTIDSSKFTVRDPKRDEDVYVCRICYNGSKNVHIKLDLVRIMDIKESSIVYVAVGKEWLHTILDIEDVLLQKTKEHAHEWFNTRMTPDIIEDFFTSSIVVHKKYGHVLKLCCKNESIQASFKPRALCNLVLTLSGLKFYKKKFNLIWSIDTYEPIAMDAKDAEDTENMDPADILDEEDRLFLGPDACDLETIWKDLAERAQNQLHLLTERRDSLTRQLESVHQSLEKVRHSMDQLQLQRPAQNFYLLEQIHDVLNEVSSQPE